MFVSSEYKITYFFANESKLMIDRVNQFDTIRQFIKMSWERRRPVVACVLCPVSVMRLLSILCGTSLKLRDERLSCVISNYLPFEVGTN